MPVTAACWRFVFISNIFNSELTIIHPQEGSFYGRTADFVFMLLIGAALLLCIAPFVNIQASVVLTRIVG